MAFPRTRGRAKVPSWGLTPSCIPLPRSSWHDWPESVQQMASLARRCSLQPSCAMKNGAGLVSSHSAPTQTHTSNHSHFPTDTRTSEPCAPPRQGEHGAPSCTKAGVRRLMESSDGRVSTVSGLPFKRLRPERLETVLVL